MLFTTYQSNKLKKKRQGKNTHKCRTKTKWKQKHAFLFAKIGIEKELKVVFTR